MDIRKNDGWCYLAVMIDLSLTEIAWTTVRRLVAQTRICNTALLGEKPNDFTQKISYETTYLQT